MRSARRSLTASSLTFLDRLDEAHPDRLLRTHPVSSHWQSLLLERLDGPAVIYRLASGVASVEGAFRFRWYRGAALDAAMILEDSRTLGIIRQGATADRFRRSLNPRKAMPRALLALMPDEARLRQDRRLLARYLGPVFLTQERDVASAVSGDPVWHLTSATAVLSLEEVLERLRPGGSLPWDPPLARNSPPRNLSIPLDPENTHDHLLPIVLKASHKEMMDRLAEWPLITASDLRTLTGLSFSGLSQVTKRLEKLGLAARFRFAGHSCLRLTRRGLAYLARRDRVSDTEVVRRWSVESMGRKFPGDVAGGSWDPHPPSGPHHRAHRWDAPVPGPHVPAGP